MRRDLPLVAGLWLVAAAVWCAPGPAGGRVGAPQGASPGAAAATPAAVARWRAMYGERAVIELAPDAARALAAWPQRSPRGGALVLAPPGRDADARPLVGPLRAGLAMRGWLALSLGAEPRAIGAGMGWLRDAPATPVVVVATAAAAATALEQAPALVADGARALVLIDAGATGAALMAAPALQRLTVLELVGARAARSARAAARERLRAARERELAWRLERVAGAVQVADDWRQVLARVDAWGRARLLAAGER